MRGLENVQSAVRETLCNHFYFPLLASLPSDLDCISQGRQRQSEDVLAVMCVCVCVCGNCVYVVASVSTCAASTEGP